MRRKCETRGRIGQSHFGGTRHARATGGVLPLQGVPYRVVWRRQTKVQGTRPMAQTIIPPADARHDDREPAILRPDEVAFLHADGAFDPTVPAVETRELRKEYGAKVAVESLTLTVRQGEVFGFLGPNGAGKSTTMKMLMGLVFPTGGAMALLGRPIGDVTVKRRVGFLPEQFRFHEW